MSGAGPFNPRVVLALIAVGGAAFLLFLYSIGAGWTGGDRAMGSGHAASKGLNGYAAFADLLARRGHAVSISRNPGRLDEEALLILTPPHYAAGEEIAELIEQRRWQGPTILVLPKWFGFDPGIAGLEDSPRGWVLLGEAEEPGWANELDAPGFETRIGTASGWRAEGRRGTLPTPKQVQSIVGSEFAALVGDGRGRTLAGYRDDGGYYALLAEYGGHAAVEVPEDADESGYWPLVIVAEPDLLNNAGMADAERARLATELVDVTLEDYDLPIVFDLTLPGLGRSENLLTLAFQPPFLAATMMLLLAALAVGWRAFARFGPPVAEVPALASGKAQLARDGATLVARARRLRLVGPPYAALVAARLGKALGLSERAAAEVRAAAIARALERRGEDPGAFAAAAERLERAQKPADLLRAARALKTIERTLAK